MLIENYFFTNKTKQIMANDEKQKKPVNKKAPAKKKGLGKGYFTLQELKTLSWG